MATITKRDTGKYQAKVRKRGFPPQSKTFRTRAQAERWAKRIESDMDDGVFHVTEASNTTLEEALERYRTEVSLKKKSGKFEQWRIELWKSSSLAHKMLNQIKGSDLAAWRDKRLATIKDNGKPVSSGTVRNDLALLSNLFNVARTEWGMETLINPISNIKKPPPADPRDHRITTGDFEAIIEQAKKLDGPIADIIEFAVETGMRRGEIALIRRDKLNRKKKTLNIPREISKTKKPREVPLSSRAIAVIDRQPAHITGEIFKVHTTNTPEYITKRFKAAAVAAGLPNLRFHDTRHEATSRFFERGFSLMEVSSITGHKTLQMLQRYTHLKAEDLAKRLG